MASRYEDAARADKEAFARQWPDGAPRKPKRAVKRRDPNAPKRAPSAYNLFVQAFYSKTPMNGAVSAILCMHANKYTQARSASRRKHNDANRARHGH